MRRLTPQALNPEFGTLSQQYLNPKTTKQAAAVGRGGGGHVGSEQARVRGPCCSPRWSYPPLVIFVKSPMVKLVNQWSKWSKLGAVMLVAIDSIPATLEGRGRTAVVLEC